jgi:hypothetical protein
MKTFKLCLKVCLLAVLVTATLALVGCENKSANQTNAPTEAATNLPAATNPPTGP